MSSATSSSSDSPQAISIATLGSTSVAWWRDYAALTKPRITLMILLTVAVAMFAAQQLHGHFVSWWIWLHTLIATSMIAGSASTLNQWFETERDMIMPRTQKRPLPSGRLTRFEAASFGWFLAIAGLLYQGLAVSWMSMLCGLTTWFVYCWIYTPLKCVTWWNTAIGTLPGALPVMIGWTAVGGSIWDWNGWALTAIVVLWQFPHFMSIAWLYRNQYASAGFRMLTKEEPTGVAAGWHAVCGALALIPLSVVVLRPDSAITWFIAILGVLSCVSQAMASYRFLLDRNDVTARKLLRASLIYLPAIMMLVVVRWSF
jgi:protoheme IX farnesyltransferase